MRIYDLGVVFILYFSFVRIYIDSLRGEVWINCKSIDFIVRKTREILIFLYYLEINIILVLRVLLVVKIVILNGKCFIFSRILRFGRYF